MVSLVLFSAITISSLILCECSLYQDLKHHSGHGVTPDVMVRPRHSRTEVLEPVPAELREDFHQPMVRQRFRVPVPNKHRPRNYNTMNDYHYYSETPDYSNYNEYSTFSEPDSSSYYSSSERHPVRPELRENFHQPNPRRVRKYFRMQVPKHYRPRNYNVVNNYGSYSETPDYSDNYFDSDYSNFYNQYSSNFYNQYSSYYEPDSSSYYSSSQTQRHPVRPELRENFHQPNVRRMPVPKHYRPRNYNAVNNYGSYSETPDYSNNYFDSASDYSNYYNQYSNYDSNYDSSYYGANSGYSDYFDSNYYPGSNYNPGRRY